jgi:hypothetical protein
MVVQLTVQMFFAQLHSPLLSRYPRCLHAQTFRHRSEVGPNAEYLVRDT